MANPFASTIRERLFAAPDESTYAVLDAARERRVYALVDRPAHWRACLYAGAIPLELAEVAPYLVRLWPDHPITDELLEVGWGRSWGIFLSAKAELEEMRRHLRRFLRVETEDGKKLIFRYYDPRVMRAYLPTCTEGELSTFFGPASTVFTEGPGGASLNVYARHRGSFSATKLAHRPGPTA